MTQWILDEMRPRSAESMEDAIIDTALILAGFVEQSTTDGNINVASLATIFQLIDEKKINARIYAVTKEKTDSRVYITDNKGVVIFDSSGRHNAQDYSKWRNIKLALSGEYGARTSHEEMFNPGGSVMHVTVPLRIKSQIIGTLTVAKPTTNLTQFLATAKDRFILFGFLSGLAVVVAAVFFTYILTSPLNRLGQYARAIKSGERTSLPQLPNDEIGSLGRDFEEMRVALEGKKYVENYVHALTHEIKSPLAAIQGAAELMDDKMSADDRAHFLKNIREESARLKTLADRLLELATLENQIFIEKSEPVNLQECINRAVQALDSALVKKNVSAVVDTSQHKTIYGDHFLIEQALINVIGNAIDFSPPNGKITITTSTRDHEEYCVICDEGQGIPDFALPQIFERFFSLPRPDTKRKSTGLGLAFVKEIMNLHQGSVRIKNRESGGTEVCLVFPV